MTPRTFATLVGVVILLVGLMALLLRITTPDAVSCGSALAPAGSSNAWAIQPECDDLIGTRRAWAWPVLLVGLFILTGARFVRFTPVARSTS